MAISSLYMVISLHPLKSTLFLQNKKLNKRPAVKKQALTPVDNLQLVLNCFSGKCNCHGLFGTKYLKSTRVKAVVVQLTADQTLEATGSFPVLKRCIWAAKARKQQRRQWQRPRAISVIRGTLNMHVHYTFLIIIIFLRGMSNLSELLGKGRLWQFSWATSTSTTTVKNICLIYFWSHWVSKGSWLINA